MPRALLKLLPHHSIRAYCTSAHTSSYSHLSRQTISDPLVVPDLGAWRDNMRQHKAIGRAVMDINAIAGK